MIAGLKRLFGDGYRVFFLAAGLYAVFTLSFWVLWLGVHWAGGMFSLLPFAMAPHLWHGHELAFGYGGAALGGFLLTAVPNWTGAKAARHLFILTASSIWLAGRIAVWFSAALPAEIVMVADLAFLPLLAAKIATQLIKRPKPQNVMFLGLLSIIWVANLMVHLEWMEVTSDTALQGLRAGIYGLCAMIAVLGGRVTPAFTRNAMVREGRETRLPVSHKPLELAGVTLAIALPIVVMVGVADRGTAVLMLACGTLQVARVIGWRPGFAAQQPILWSLHLSFALIGVGLILHRTGAVGHRQRSRCASRHRHCRRCRDDGRRHEPGDSRPQRPPAGGTPHADCSLRASACGGGISVGCVRGIGGVVFPGSRRCRRPVDSCICVLCRCALARVLGTSHSGEGIAPCSTAAAS